MLTHNVDARPRHLFLGEPAAANTGHIPGSRCLPYQELVDGATGLWASPAAVARLARDAGIDPDWSRWISRTLLGVEAIELPGGHFPMLEHTAILADVLEGLSASRDDNQREPSPT